MRPVPHLEIAPGVLLISLAALAGCGSVPPPDPAADPALSVVPPEPAPAPSEPATEPAADARGAAQTALAAGDIAATRAALDALVTAPLLATCEAHLLAGRVEEALTAAEDALATSPELPAALFLAGACRANLAERVDEAQPLERERQLEGALELLERARGCAGALATASRIARELGHTDDALALARTGTAGGAAPCADIERVAAWAIAIEPPERALALAALAAWRERRESDPEAAAALFAEVEDALGLAMSDSGNDAWVWRTQGEAYLEAGRAAEARATLVNGVDRLAADRDLFDLLWDAARKEGGTNGVVKVFAGVQAKRPDLALAWWYPGIEQFEAALRAATDPRRLFDEAERALRTCRTKVRADPKLVSECLRYETLCRTGRGWSWLDHGDLERAWNEFRTAGEHDGGGLRLEQPPLFSAREGLQALIERHLSRGELPGAARAAERLAADAPDDVRLVRQAGDLTRDLGDRLHLLERDLKLAGGGDLWDAQRLEELRVEIGTSRPGDDLRGTARERDKFFDIGVRRGLAARETYLRSLGYYRRALELAPDDLRLGCDAAALVVRRLADERHLRELAAEVRWTEELLLRLVDVGRGELERGVGDEQARYAFEEAFGDVHQLLGELYLVQRKQPRAARTWFERCLAIGPVPRSEVSEKFLPLCLAEERKQAEGRR